MGVFVHSQIIMKEVIKMGFRFRKSFKIALRVKLNSNKKSTGVTLSEIKDCITRSTVRARKQ